MTTTRISGPRIAVACTNPAAPALGDSVRLGKACGVALAAEHSSLTAVDFGVGVFEVLVDDTGGGILVGAPLYYHDVATGDGPTSHVNDAAGGADAFFGFALEAVNADATTRIKVLRTASAAII